MTAVKSYWLDAKVIPPPKGKCILIENPGGVPIIGIWSDHEDFKYWAPLPEKRK